MILVKGTPYRTSLKGAMQLRTMRRVKEETGLGWGTITEFVGEIKDETPLGDVMSEVKFLAWLWAWVLNAGGELSFEDMVALTVDDIEFTTDDESPAAAEMEAPDPTAALPDSAQGGEHPPRPAKAASKPATKTSKKPSTHGSR